MESVKLKKVAALSLGLHLSAPSNNKTKAALVGLALHLNQKPSTIHKVALISLSLYLHNNLSKPISNKKVAVVALLYHLRLEEMKIRGLSNQQFIIQHSSAWAFKGFLMRQIPNKIPVSPILNK